MSAHKLIVTPDQNGLRLDILVTQYVDVIPSRTWAKHLIEEGYVTVNQHPVTKPHHKMKTGDELLVAMMPLAEADPLEPQDIALDIFYEDSFIAVINKPAGMLVHPAAGCRSGTLVNALLFRYGELSSVHQDFRPGIVHRLDRETSGLLVVAKDNRSHIRLTRQFEKHRVRKKYIARVKGRVEFDEGRVDARLGRHPLHFDKRAVAYDEQAKSAETYYRVIKRFGTDSTLLALKPRTGRTHQLRVHMAYLGHPILGDDKYGTPGGFPRLALHAQTLGFAHPQHQCWLEFSAPAPQEFFMLV